MIVMDRLNKAICYFAGGFGYATMDDEGELWKFTVKSAGFDEQGAMILTEGKFTMDARVVLSMEQNGKKHGFMKAVENLYERYPGPAKT